MGILRRYSAWAMVAALVLVAPLAQAQANWANVAFVSSTMGANANRLCVGESTRGDIGCPTYAPTLFSTGRLALSGLSGSTFEGITVENTSPAGGAQITYGIAGIDAAAIRVQRANGLSTQGQLSLFVRTDGSPIEHFRLVSTGLAIGNIGVPSTSLHIKGTLRIANGGEVCDADRAGGIRYNSGTFEFCSGSSWQSLAAVAAAGANAATNRISTTGVASGVTLAAVQADMGTVSFTLGGTPGAAYLHPSLGLVASGVSTTGIGRFESISSTGNISANQFIGDGSLLTNISASALILGLNSLTDAINTSLTAPYNLIVGHKRTPGLGAGYNTAVGLQSLVNVIDSNNTGDADNSGDLNTALGYASLRYNTTGGSNAAVGVNALLNNTTGSLNTAVGLFALGANTAGNANTAVGYATLGGLAGSASSGNTVIGHWTGSGIVTGSSNTIIGANVTGLASDLNNTVIIADGSGNRRIYVHNDGNVGLGTTSPTTRLHVNGTLRIANGNEGCDTDRVGGMRYNSGTFEFCSGSAWQSLAAVASAGGVTTNRISTTGVASGATLAAVQADMGTVSFTLGGTPGAAYLHPSLGLVASGVSTTGGISGSTGYFAGNVGVGQAADPANRIATQIAASDSPVLAIKGSLQLPYNVSGAEPVRIGVFENTNFVAGTPSVGSAVGLTVSNFNYESGTGSTAIQAGVDLGNGGIDLQARRTNSSSVFDLAKFHRISAQIFTSNTARMTIDAVGNVGIGTTAPSYTLHVVGTTGTGNDAIAITSPYADRWSQVTLLNSSNSLAGNFGYGNVNAPVFADQIFIAARNSTAPIVLATNNTTERLRITNLGLVGISTTAPSTTLHVNGTLRIANGGEACDADRAGGIRYSGGGLSFCNGTAWTTLAAGGSTAWGSLSGIPANVTAVENGTALTMQTLSASVALNARRISVTDVSVTRNIDVANALTAGSAGFGPVAMTNLTAAGISASNVSATGNISANRFIGDGSLLTGLPSGATDRISSTNNQAMVVARSEGTVSFTLGGTPGAAYLHPSLGLVASGVSTTGAVSGSAGFFTQLRVGAAAACASDTAGAIRYTGGALSFCNGSAWATLGSAGAADWYGISSIPAQVQAVSNSGAIVMAGVSSTNQSVTTNLTVGGALTAGSAGFGPVAMTNLTAAGISASNVSVTGNISANRFIGDGSLLTGLPSGATDRISSTNNQAMVVARSEGTVSFTLGGTPGAAYLHPSLGLVASGVSTTGIGRFASISSTGNISANQFIGDGSRLTGLSSASIALAIDDLTDAATNYTTSYTLFVGQNAGYQNTGTYVTGVGGNTAYQNGGNHATAFGGEAVRGNTGANVTGLGYQSAYQNTGSHVTSIGFASAYQNLANFVVAVGGESARNNTGANVTGVGYESVYQNTGANVTGLGFGAGYQNTAANVVAIGYEAGKGNAASSQFILKQASVNAMPLIQGDFSTGNVGIGITSPSYKLDVAGDVRFNAGGMYTHIRFGPEARDSIITDGEGSYGGGYFFRVHDNTAPLSYRDVMMLAENGRVGIGRLSPTTQMDISGTLRLANGGEACDANRAGGIRYNAGTFEFCSGSAWQSLSAVASAAMDIDDLTDAASNTVSNTLFIGNNAGFNSTAIQSTLIGHDAGYNNTQTGVTAVGLSAGYSNTGAALTAFGVNAGFQNFAAEVTAIGQASARFNSGTAVTAVGHGAAFLNSGTASTALGAYSLYNNTGINATGLGYLAGYGNTGSNLTAVGLHSAFSNTGSNNIFLGVAAGYANTGSNAAGLGYAALQNNTGSYVIGVGEAAAKNNTANNVIAIGYEAGMGNAAANQFIVKQTNVNATPLIQGDFSTGNVGIGITSPSYTLDVAGSVRFNSGGTYTHMRLGPEMNDAIITDGNGSAGGGYFFRVHDNTAPLSYRNVLMLAENGRVGIGTLSPTTHMDISGTLRVGNSGLPCDGTRNGSIRYTNGRFEACTENLTWRAIPVRVAVPTTATDACTVGEVAYSSTFIYFCINTNTWRRATAASW